MKFKILAAIIISAACSNCFSQEVESSLSRNNIQELKSQVLNTKLQSRNPEINFPAVTTKKSPGLALLFSLILPGAGHYYLNRMDVGKYYLGVDAVSWIGLVSLNLYGNSVRDNSRTFSHEHAGISNISDKPDDYFANIGNFQNIYQYNNDQLNRGQFGSLYDVNQFFWNWDNVNNESIFEQQRKNSERIYNSRIIFGSLLIANRVISAISAYFIANHQQKSTSSLNFEPELLYNRNYSFDGFKINLSKNF